MYAQSSFALHFAAQSATALLRSDRAVPFPINSRKFDRVYEIRKSSFVNLTFEAAPKGSSKKVMFLVSGSLSACVVNPESTAS